MAQDPLKGPIEKLKSSSDVVESDSSLKKLMTEMEGALKAKDKKYVKVIDKLSKAIGQAKKAAKGDKEKMRALADFEKTLKDDKAKRLGFGKPKTK